MPSTLEIPNLSNTRTDQFFDLLSGEVLLEGDFSSLMPVHHILTATIAEGEITQKGSGRFIEYEAVAGLSQPNVSSYVSLSRDLMHKRIWTPSTLEFVGPQLSRLTIDLYERNGIPLTEIVGFSCDSICEEVARFLRLASNAYKR